MAFFRKDGSFQRVRSLGKIILYAFLVICSGALVAPWAWVLIQYLPVDSLHGLVGEVQRMPFHRYLSRSFQVAGIVLLWPLLRSLHVRSLQEFGLFPSHLGMRDFLTGLAAGVPSALLLSGVTWASGAFDFHLLWSLKVAYRILLTAVVVAMLEEFLFRGVILGFLRQFLSRWMAITISAVIFASLHFLNLPSSGKEVVPSQWWSGFSLLISLGENLPAWPMSAWAFATLFAAGILLAWLTTRTGSLWAPIALHGTWILAQQFFNSMARYRDLPSEAFLPIVGPAQCHGAVPVGLDALLCLVVAGMISAFMLRNRPWPRIYTRVSW
ncbi:MAG: CPBP family intramembrane glutamic endopeptidase [bacterium]